MKRPSKKDYETSGSMINPYGSYDFESYANELEKYSNYLESKVKNLGIHGVVFSEERAEVCLKGYEYGCYECMFCEQKHTRYCVESKRT